MSDVPSFELEADEGELPSVDSVVAELEGQGVTSFDEDADDSVSDIDEEVEFSEVEETDGVEIDEDGESIEFVVDSEEEGGEEESEEVSEDENAENDDSEEEEVAAKSSSDYADILAKKRALEAKELELSAKSNQENDRIAELEAKIAEMSANSGKKPRSPSEALAAAGFDYETATKEQLGAFEAEPVVEETTEQKLIRELQERLEKMESTSEQKAKEEQENQYTRAKAHMLSEIEKTATAEGHEYIAHLGENAFEYVNSVMVAYYQTHGQMLDIKVACDIVEQEYEKDVLGKIANSPKFQKKFQSSKKSETPLSKESGKKTPSKKSKTLKRGSSAGINAKPDMDSMSSAKAKEQMAKMLIFHED